ncbi:MAG: response regulator, partial [Anaerolineae bacterium]|nr:response regulator [Anaerolineae bacterium]
MSMPKRILIVDPEEETRVRLVTALNNKGYSVLTAVNLTEVDERLRQAVIHLAVTEIMVEPGQTGSAGDPLEPAKALRKYDIPFIVFSRHDDPENIRRAHRERAIDHFSKSDNPSYSELLLRIDKAFSEMTANLALQINGSPDPATIAAQLPNPKVTNPFCPTADDVSHILQNLFHEDTSILIYPLLKDKAQTGSVLLRVRPRRQKWARQVVVKLSTRDEIKRDMAAHRHLQRHIGSNVDLEEDAYSREWGGFFCRLSGVTELENIRTVKDVFIKEDLEEITALLKIFFETPRKITGSTEREPMNLFQVYTNQLNLDVVPSDKSEGQPSKLHFEGLDRDFLDPADWLPSQDKLAFEVFSQRFPCCSYLRGENILIENRNYWPLDFAHIGEGHALNDFAEMETDIKFNFLSTLPSLTDRFHFEHLLLAPSTLATKPDNIPFEDKGLERAYHTIMTLRYLASELVQLNNNGKPEYYQALLFHTLDVWQRQEDEKLKEQALLAAALLCERLDKWPNWDDPNQVNRMAPEEDGVSISPSPSQFPQANSTRSSVGLLVSNETPYNTNDVRDLVMATFDDQELMIYCFDNFRPVYNKFALEMSYIWKIQLLIDYCEKHDQFDELLAYIKGNNPNQYSKFIPLIERPSQPSTTMVSTSRSQIEITLIGISVIAALSIITLLAMLYFEVPLFGYMVVLVLIVFFAIIFFVLDNLISAKDATQRLQEMVLAL